MNLIYIGGDAILNTLSDSSLNRTGNAFRKKMDQVYYEMEYLRLPKEMQVRNSSVLNIDSMSIGVSHSF